jgi:hypothetical protein
MRTLTRARSAKTVSHPHLSAGFSEGVLMRLVSRFFKQFLIGHLVLLGVLVANASNAFAMRARPYLGCYSMCFDSNGTCIETDNFPVGGSAPSCPSGTTQYTFCYYDIDDYFDHVYGALDFFSNDY